MSARWGALVVGMVVAIATTSGPQAWGATFAAVIAIAIVFACTLSTVRAAPFVACLSLGLAAGQDLLQPGIALGHDLHAHGWGAYTLWNALVDGGAWPRWDPYLGLGMPLLQFYAPLGFVLCWPFQALGFSTIDAMKAALLLAHVASAGAAWWAAGRLGGDRTASALAATAYSFAPYHLLDLNVRLAWGELFAFPAVPLVLAGVVRRDLRVIALSGALLVVSHVLTALLLAPVVALAVLGPALARLRSSNTGRGNPGFRSLALGAAFALGFTAWFWLPFLVERGATSLADVAGDAPSTVAAVGLEAFERASWAGYRIRARIEAGTLEGGTESMGLYAGAVLVALVVAALGPRRSRGWAVGALALFALGVYPLAMVVDLVPGWNRMQFAFRVWGPATAMASLAIGLAFGGDGEHQDGRDSDRARRDNNGVGPMRRHAFIFAALLALVWDAGPWLAAPIRIPPTVGLSAWVGAVPTPMDLPDGQLLRVEGAMFPPGPTDRRIARAAVVYPELLTPPLRALIGRPSRPPSRAVSEALGVALRLPWSGPTTTLSPGPYVHERVGTAWRGLNLAVERRPGALSFASDGAARTIRLVEAWFTGWRVRFDGGPWADASSADGLLMVDVPAGVSRVDLTFGSWYPWDRALGNLVSIASVILFALWRPR